MQFDFCNASLMWSLKIIDAHALNNRGGGGSMKFCQISGEGYQGVVNFFGFYCIFINKLCESFDGRLTFCFVHLCESILVANWVHAIAQLKRQNINRMPKMNSLQQWCCGTLQCLKWKIAISVSPTFWKVTVGCNIIWCLALAVFKYLSKC